MRFPDRPVTTAILGVVCGLVLLGVLSSPGLVPSLKSSSTVQYQQSFTSQTTNKQESFSGSPAANNSFAVTLSKTSETNSFQSATSRSTEVIIPTTTLQSTTVTSASVATSVVSQQSVQSGNNSFSFDSLLSLSGVALVVAFGSMFFVHRKVNKEDSEEA